MDWVASISPLVQGGFGNLAAYLAAGTAALGSLAPHQPGTDQRLQVSTDRLDVEPHFGRQFGNGGVTPTLEQVKDGSLAFTEAWGADHRRPP